MLTVSALGCPQFYSGRIPQNVYVEGLTPTVIAFGDRAFEKVKKVGVPAWHSQLSIELSVPAQIMISGL